jgi:hypothetical protein
MSDLNLSNGSHIANAVMFWDLLQNAVTCSVVPLHTISQFPTATFDSGGIQTNKIYDPEQFSNSSTIYTYDKNQTTESPM